QRLLGWVSSRADEGTGSGEVPLSVSSCRHSCVRGASFQLQVLERWPEDWHAAVTSSQIALLHGLVVARLLFKVVQGRVTRRPRVVLLNDPDLVSAKQLEVHQRGIVGR